MVMNLMMATMNQMAGRRVLVLMANRSLLRQRQRRHQLLRPLRNLVHVQLDDLTVQIFCVQHTATVLFVDSKSWRLLVIV